MTAMKHASTRWRCGIIAAAAVLFCLDCPQAQAHLVTTGLGPVYDGIAHLALSPGDRAVVVVLVLLAAMRGARQGRWLLALLPAAWLVGGLGGLTFPITANLGWATGLSFLLAGALVAADLNLPLLVVASLAVFIGGFHGVGTGAALAQASSGGLELAGELVALIVVMTLVAGLVVSLKAFWMRIVVRVLGSWIAATGLLMIGWSLRAGR